MPDFTLDHVVIAVRDLDAATADYTKLFGREPSWKGSHPTYGTRNSLFRIENTYIELLGLGGKKGKDGRWAGELQRHLQQGEGVYALAFGYYDINLGVKQLRDAGLPVLDPADGSGVDEITGNKREWRNAMVPVKATHGVRMFFIEHRSLPDALPMAPITASGGACVKRMDHAVVLSADMEMSRHLWRDQLGARLALDRTFPERNTRILFFRLGDITIEISGGATQTEEGMGKPDRLWGLAWGVDDVEAACARLRNAGVDVSDPRRGIKPGTRVATVKGEHTHGVATLLIEHSPESFQPQSRIPQGAAYDNAEQQPAFRASALRSVTLSTSDMAETTGTWQRTLGLHVTQTHQPADLPLRLALMPAGNAFIELAQPLSDAHPMAETIAERGAGMYGIAITVDNIEHAVADLRAKGIPVSDVEYGLWPGTRAARIEKSATHGVAITLIQPLPEVL
jgi:catechol 2,3-dioxygenase-like lactoylglutathione lyase family enzyme